MVRYQIATRAQILGLLAAGLPGKVVEEHTGISTATQYRWWDKAVARGFDPNKRPLLILDEHVEDGKRPGRPRRTQEGEQGCDADCDAVDCMANDMAQEGLGLGRLGNESENENENDAHHIRQLDAAIAEFPDPQDLPLVHQAP